MPASDREVYDPASPSAVIIEAARSGASQATLHRMNADLLETKLATMVNLATRERCLRTITRLRHLAAKA